ncbi:MAG: tripartite tricarboxylate transporter substrate binding protein [Alphaproteobacteria bacterium]|nr:tripartite tricarboxylate transporter substrate binding protein [Alphaproteobacteria bacterium]
MNPSFRFSRRQALTIAALSVLPAGAQSPANTNPIKLIVPFTPGTGIDIVARQIGPKLAQKLNRPVVVENRVGASGSIGTEAVVRSAPDGNTLLVSVNTLVMNRALNPALPFDPLKDLTPIALTSWGELILVTHPKTGWKTAKDLVLAAKSAPGRINYASPGVGTPHHMSMELFKNTAKVFITHIPYRGTAPAVTDILGGQVDVMFLPIHVALAHVKTGRLVALAIGSERRHALMPDLPTVTETGLGQVNVGMWFGVFAPKGMLAEQVASLNREINQIIAGDDVKTAFSTQGMDPASATPADFARLVERDADKWARLVKDQGIKPE